MTPIERVARLVYDNVFDRPDAVPQVCVQGWDELSASGRELYCQRARAVIAAIRKPSEGQQIAGVNAPNYLEDQSSRRGCANIYTAMIDALLEEGK